MTMFQSLRLVPDGIAFSVHIDDTEHACLIADCALERLYACKGTTLNLQHVYHAYESKIHGVAKQRILSGRASSPLVLTEIDFH